MPHGINHSGNALIVLIALFPYLHDHIRLAVIDKGMKRVEKLGNAKDFGIIADNTRHAVLKILQREDLFQTDPALRHRSQDVKHVNENEGIRGVVTAERNIQVYVFSA